MGNLMLLCLIFFLGMSVGNYVGDQATIKNYARMAGGGSVKCEVQKETK